MSIKFCIAVRPDTNCYLNEEFKEVWDLNEAKLYDTVECVQSQTNLKKIEWKDYWEVIEIYTLTEKTYKKVGMFWLNKVWALKSWMLFYRLPV